jgi:hypothetical protein
MAMAAAGCHSGSKAASAAPPPPAFADMTLGRAFQITAPDIGDVTDGGLVVQSMTSDPITAENISLSYKGRPAGIPLTETRVFHVPLGSDRAVGIRPGLPSTLSTETPPPPLANARLSSGEPYEVLIGIRVPASGGPWRADSVRLTYQDAGRQVSQVFVHNLTVCRAGQEDCAGPGTVRRTASLGNSESSKSSEASGSDSATAPGSDSAAAATSALSPGDLPAGLPTSVGDHQSQGAQSVCTPETTTAVTGKPRADYIATNVHSGDWQGGKGQITMERSETATTSATASDGLTLSEGGSLDFEFFSLEVSAKKSWNVSITKETSTTTTWSYTLEVSPNPRGQRLTVYVKGWALPITTTVLHADCTSDVLYGTAYAPATDVDPTDPSGNYCVAVDVEPGIKDLGPYCHGAQV